MRQLNVLYSKTEPHGLMVKLALIVLLSVIASTNAFSQNQGASIQTKKITNSKTNWFAAADSAQQALVKHFWRAEQHYFIQDNQGNKNFNYWWQAHAMDVLLDGYERTKDQKYLQRLDELHSGIRQKNKNTYLNEYYDDMEWLALACLRVYQVTKNPTYKATANLLWTDIKTGWSDYMSGGISWKKTQLTYKNTPANAPACILAARLYGLTKNPDDLEWAKKIYAWEKQNLVDPITGLVWDGRNRQGDDQIDKKWPFSYNQGVFIGAGLELYKVTKDRTYLQDAHKTANFVLNNPVFLPVGIFKSEGNGDGGLFKAIFIRYLTNLITDGKLKAPVRKQYIAILKKNGEMLLRQGTSRPAYLFSPDLTKLPTAKVESSVQISGVTLLEALTRLQRLGRLK